MKSALSGIALLLFLTAIAALLTIYCALFARRRSPGGLLTQQMRDGGKILTVSRAHAHLFRHL